MLSVVIPAYNEGAAIKATVETLKGALTGAETIDKFEIIVVNDGSSDGTGDILEELKGIRVIHHPHNIGYGKALKTGIKAAKFDAIAISDADGTYPINEIPRLLEIYNAGYDMVVGARTGSVYRGSGLKFRLRRALRVLVEFAAGRSIEDINSGLRIFSRKTSMLFFHRFSDRFSFTTSITLVYMFRGKFVVFSPIDYYDRLGSTKVGLFRDSIRTFQQIVQLINYYNPIKIFVILCLFLTSVSSFPIFYGVLVGSENAILLGVGGLILIPLIFALGLVADVTSQIHRDRE
ncbi:MAG: family 2 glycosyl transferase [Magnetovibrio sp.]|nr:family 2 glycosyl transferase [Magnetovibrio sp.]